MPPSRSAATGAIRVARRAGPMPAMVVIPTPTASETSTVRVANTVPALGRSMSLALNRALIPLARPTPAMIPRIEATNPVTIASSTTEPRICRREAPIIRSSPNSLVR
jgi:hypothetical protein